MQTLETYSLQLVLEFFIYFVTALAIGRALYLADVIQNGLRNRAHAMVLAGFALFLSPGQVWSSATPPSEIAQPEAEVELRLKAAIDRAAGTSSMTDAMRAAFPDHYQRLMSGYRTQLGRRAGDSEIQSDDAGRLMMRFMRDTSQILQAKYADIAKAPDARLHAIAKAARDAAIAFQAIPHLCAAFALGQRTQSDSASRDAASTEQKRAVAELFAAATYAARDGADHPVTRDFSTIPEEMIAAVTQKLGGPERFELLADEARFRAASAETQCELTITWYRAVSDLPEAQSALLTAVSYMDETPPAPKVQ
jgi:hypothetical protein